MRTKSSLLERYWYFYAHNKITGSANQVYGSGRCCAIYDVIIIVYFMKIPHCLVWFFPLTAYIFKKCIILWVHTHTPTADKVIRLVTRPGGRSDAVYRVDRISCSCRSLEGMLHTNCDKELGTAAYVIFIISSISPQPPAVARYPLELFGTARTDTKHININLPTPLQLTTLNRVAFTLMFSSQTH